LKRRVTARACGVLLQLALAAACFAPEPGFAEQRALLVGVGKYDLPGIDLPGIDLDIQRMHEMLNLMGFEDRQIHILQDEAATSTNVIAEFNGWLRQGVQADDRVVFYFSGHGSNVPDLNGDQDADVSQVLVTHDVKRVREQGHASLAGVIIDTKISHLLAAIPSKHVLFIVDSCHSGTVTRSFTLRNRSLAAGTVFVKSFNYPGMPAPLTPMRTRQIDAPSREPQWDPKTNYVALTAAADREEAIGTSKGGIFTIGLTEAVKRLAGEGKNITVRELRAESEDYIRSKTDKDQVHTPQMMGNATLADAPLKMAAPNAVNGPNRKQLLALVAAQPQRFEIAASSPSYAIEQPVQLTLVIPAAGYLNLVSVDSQDNATVLFPNRYQQDNAVTAGSFVLPTPKMAFELRASAPAGATLVVGFVSSDPTNFYEETIDDRDENGNIKADFSVLSHTATRAIRVAPRSSQNYAAQLELQIVEAAYPVH
jgi:hypothetical protein